MVKSGDVLAVIKGPLQKLLIGERVILNLIQRMSAIATVAHLAVQETVGTHAKYVIRVKHYLDCVC